MNGSPSVKVALFIRNGGSEFPCRCFYITGIYNETDKHCRDNIQVLCWFLAMNGVMCEKIKDIFVLGQSMSPVDIEYFDFLMRSCKVAYFLFWRHG